MKNTIAMLICLALLVSSVPVFAEEETSEYAEYVSFARTVTDYISSLGDNEDIGNRSSGSEAEQQAAEYIEATMQEIGLTNVTVDTFTCDNWSFNRGRVYYTDANGEQQYLLLGGFATNFTADMMDAQIVYLGDGTAEDYEGVDVNGKVVLIDIDQASDWWIEIPVYEAYIHGALCVLACNVSGYAYYDEDTIGSQDICGPDYAPAFAVSQNSAKTLQELIEQGGGEATITLDVESVVTMDGQSQNVYGEIQGATDEVILVFAHMDGYYHSYFDDASGVGTMLAMAKYLVDSGITPDKTIRFVAHGSEEWGDSDTEYDWAIGAFVEATQLHPDWAESAFAILSIDGLYPVEGHTGYSVAASWELADFADEIAQSVYEDSDYEIETTSPATCWTEEFSYVRQGVPVIVASYATPDEIYHNPAYHSTMDNVILGVDEEAWAKSIELFVRYAQELDALACRPVDFAARFEALSELYSGEADIDRVIEAADALTQVINQLNSDYAAALAEGDTETAAELRAQGIALDTKTHEILTLAVTATTALDWEDNIVFPFEVTEWNIEALEASIACLNEGDAQTALDEYLYNIDYNWYAYDFSYETYAYMLDKMYNKADGTWGEGLIQYPGEDLWAVIHSLYDKLEEGSIDFADEIAALEESLARQYTYAEETEAALIADIDAIAVLLESAV